MLKRYPHTLRWRQALPPVFVLSFFILFVLSLWFTFARYLFAAQLLAYFSILGLAGLKLAINKRKGFFFGGCRFAISTMHFSWGAGFLWSGVLSLFKKNG
jgi:succinoglycan biosynthesis protein ExoA